jgi:hypothetical protein
VIAMTRSIEPVYFQSRNNPNFLTFFAICPEGTTAEEIFRAPFWKRVAETAATKQSLVVDSLIRLRAADRTFDLMLVVSGFRSDLTPVLQGWPTDPFVLSKADVKLPSLIPRTLPEACEVLGISLDASEEIVKKVADALRVANHPDHARDEADRQRREAKSKQINSALDLLTGKRRAA